MNENTTMYEFRESKQIAFDEACCAFAITENMEQIAKECGVTGGMLRNKLNPDQPHKLTPVELMLITKVSGNYNILNSVLLGLDIVTAPINKHGDHRNMMERALQSSADSGDLAKLAMQLGNKENLGRTERQSIIQKAQDSIGNLVMLMSDVENRTTGITPFLSMGVDFLANGAPIPGLS